jgi:T5SS/PEP-CTERM-associated repeat protein
MAGFYWYGGSGDLGDANNWVEDPPVIDPVTGQIIPFVPGPDDNAFIDGSGALTGSVLVQSAYVSGDFDLYGSLAGTLVVDGTLSVQSGASVNGYVVVNGTLSVLGGFVQSNAFDDNGSVTFNSGSWSSVGFNEDIGSEGFGLGVDPGDGDGTFTQNGGTNTITGGGLTVGYGQSASGIYYLNAGSLSADFENIGVAGTGSFFQTGGTNTTGTGGVLLGGQAGSNGSYTQTGGTNSVTGNLVLGYASGGDGTYELEAGLLTADWEVIGDQGSGSFTQKDTSTNTVSLGLILGNSAGGSGTYNLGGSGTLSVGGNLTLGSQAGSSGTFNYDTNPGDAATLAISGGSVVVGASGTGIFNQGGGTLNATLDIGSSAGGNGTYNLTGGTLNDDLIIGDAGAGTFNDTGGTQNVTGNLILGNQAGSQGTYTLSGTGTLNIVADAGGNRNLVVGDSGQGAYNQEHGTVVADNLFIGEQAGSTGTVTVSGPGTILTALDPTSGIADQIGFYGTGTLDVSDGAEVDSDASLVLANQPSASGTLAVATGGLVNSPLFTIGGGYTPGGTALVTASTGGIITATEEAFMYPGVTIDVTGGGSFDVGPTVTPVAGAVKIGEVGVLHGAGTINGDVIDNGTVGVVGGTLTIIGDLTDDGTVNVTDESASGLNVNGNVTIGKGSGTNGTFNLDTNFGDAATSDITGQLIIGNDGAGTFTQGGGSNTVDGQITIAKNAGANGVYDLEGGTLSASVIQVNPNGVLTGQGLIDSNIISQTALTIDNNGTLAITGGTLVIDGNVTGNGQLEIDANSTLELGGAASGGSITFDPSGTGETLIIDGTTMPTDVISGFAPGDTIDLKNVSLDPGGYTLFETNNNSLQNNNLLEIVENGTTYDLQLDPTVNFAGGFALSADSTGTGTDITATPGLVAGSTLIGQPVVGSILIPQPVTGYSTSNFSSLPASLPDPYSAVCSITEDGPAGLFGGSGFIIGPNTILTAAHVVLDDETNQVAPEINVDVDGVSIAVNPSDVCVDLPQYIPGVVSAQNSQYDFAIIEVPGPGINLSASYGEFNLMPDYPGGTVNITGYPGNPPGFGIPDNGEATAQFNDIGTVSKNPLLHILNEGTAVSYEGDSGGPLWVYNGSTAEAVGIVSSDDGDVQLTPSDLTLIDSWEDSFVTPAVATIDVNPISLGNFRQQAGGTAKGAVSITNSASAPAEALDGEVGIVTSITPDANANATGSFTGLAAGQTNDTSIVVGLSTASAGDQSGSATLNFQSDGTGIDSNGVTQLSPQTVNFSAAVYREATYNVAASPSSLIVHVGTSVAVAVTVSNTAANDGFSENLLVSVAGTNGGISAEPPADEIAPQGSDNVILSFSTATAGIVSGAATLDLESDGTGIDGFGPTEIGQQIVTLNATVDNYAIATLEQVSGAGTFGGNAATGYTLNFGTVQLDSGAATVDLGALNAAIGPSDLLEGSFVIGANSGAFTDSNFTAFTGLGAGAADTAPTVTLNTGTAGTFSETITLDATGYNASGYSGALTPLTLTVTGTVTVSGYGPDTWVGPPSNQIGSILGGAWNTPADWSSGVPGVTNEAILDASTTAYTVTSSTSNTIGSLSINGPSGTATATATLSVTGSTFTIDGAATNAGTILLDQDSDSDTSGTYLYVEGALNNEGAIQIGADASLVIAGPLTGSGTIDIAGGGVLSLGATASGGTIAFGSGGTAEVEMDGAAAPADAISGFGVGDAIDLAELAYKTSYEATFYPNAGGGTLEVVDTAAGDSVLATVTLTSSVSGGLVTLAQDASDGTDISFQGDVDVTVEPGDVVVSGITGQPYSAYEELYSGGVYAGIDYFFTNVTSQPYSSYTYDYSPCNDFVGSEIFYTTVPTGANYTGYEYDYDGGGNVTRVDVTGVTGAAYSSYEYDFVAGVFSGWKFEVTTVPTGATYSSYELDYNSADAFTGDKFFFTDITGQSYTGEKEDFDANGALTRVLITGVTGQAYSSLEEDYSAGTYTGYKAYYTITGQSYTGEEVDVSATNQLEKVVYTGMSSTPYSSVEEDFSAGALNGEIYDFTNVSGTSYYAYQVQENASGVAQQEILDNNDGSHTIIGLGAAGQTFTSIADDTFTGGGANETFVVTPIFGSDTITDFYQYTSGATHDTISLSTSEFANFAAVLGGAQNVGANVVITATDGDTLTLDNVSTAMLNANPGDFTFHA